MDSLETLQPAKKLSRFDIQSLVNNLPGMAYRCRWSGAWGMEFVSNGSKALTGYAPDELINAEHAWVKLLHPDDLTRVYEEIRTALDQERPFLNGKASRRVRARLSVSSTPPGHRSGRFGSGRRASPC